MNAIRRAIINVLYEIRYFWKTKVLGMELKLRKIKGTQEYKVKWYKKKKK